MEFLVDGALWLRVEVPAHGFAGFVQPLYSALPAAEARQGGDWIAVHVSKETARHESTPLAERLTRRM